ncbi:MAG: hypothetical protein VX278_24155 [Myxococcota bacterium]|nr:hypothetical protein [Myxococcota bacterium]
MNKTILFALTLTSMTACSNFEAVDHSNPNAIPSYSIEESSDYAIFDTSESESLGLHEDNLVMNLEGLDVAVYEIESREATEANPNWVGYDNKHSLERIKDLDLGSQLWYELFNQRDLSIAYVGAAPSNMLKMSEEVGHRVVSFQTGEEVIYESELVKGVIQAMEKEVEYLYLPLSSTDLPDILLKAVDHAKAEEIRVFDKAGNQL